MTQLDLDPAASAAVPATPADAPIASSAAYPNLAGRLTLFADDLRAEMATCTRGPWGRIEYGFLDLLLQIVLVFVHLATTGVPLGAETWSESRDPMKASDRAGRVAAEVATDEAPAVPADDRRRDVCDEGWRGSAAVAENEGAEATLGMVEPGPAHDHSPAAGPGRATDPSLSPAPCSATERPSLAPGKAQPPRRLGSTQRSRDRRQAALAGRPILRKQSSTRAVRVWMVKAQRVGHR